MYQHQQGPQGYDSLAYFAHQHLLAAAALPHCHPPQLLGWREANFHKVLAQHFLQHIWFGVDNDSPLYREVTLAMQGCAPVARLSSPDKDQLNVPKMFRVAMQCRTHQRCHIGGTGWQQGDGGEDGAGHSCETGMATLAWSCFIEMPFSCLLTSPCTRNSAEPCSRTSLPSAVRMNLE